VRSEAVDRLRCPACGGGFEVDPIRVGGGEDGGVPGDLVEAYLVCRGCRAAHPLLGGIAVLSRDVPRHLRTHGNVYRRVPIADPRVTRYVLGNARDGVDHVPFEEVVARYADLVVPVPGRAPAAPAPVDAALDDALRALPARGFGLDVGCGVGRGVFVLAGRLDGALGLDRSVARVRRAHNVQRTDEFRVRGAGDAAGDESPLDLSRLRRDAVDFAVADPEALPVATGAFDVVVLRARDGEGTLADAAGARREAERALAPGGTLLVEREENGVPSFDVVAGRGGRPGAARDDAAPPAGDAGTSTR
jgi:hypothetical protein